MRVIDRQDSESLRVRRWRGRSAGAGDYERASGETEEKCACMAIDARRHFERKLGNAPQFQKWDPDPKTVPRSAGNKSVSSVSDSQKYVEGFCVDSVRTTRKHLRRFRSTGREDTHKDLACSKRVFPAVLVYRKEKGVPRFCTGESECAKERKQHSRAGRLETGSNTSEKKTIGRRWALGRNDA